MHRNVMFSLCLGVFGALTLSASSAMALTPWDEAADILLKCSKEQAHDIAKNVKKTWKSCEAMRGERKVCRKRKRSCKRLCKQAHARGKDRRTCKKSCRKNKRSCVKVAKQSLDGRSCKAANRALIAELKKVPKNVGRCAVAEAIGKLEVLARN